MTRLAGVPREFTVAAMAAPYLERDEEHTLAVRWRDQRDAAALHRLAAAHMRLVIAISSRFRGFGLPPGDTIQEGHVGLLEAAARFDPDRGVRFSTYASWWIKAAIQDYVLRNWSIVRGGTSSAQKALFFNLRRLRARLLAGRSTHTADAAVYGEIAVRLKVSPEDVALMDARLSGPDSSLNAPLGDAEGTSERQDHIADEAPIPEAVVESTIDGARRLDWLRSAMGVLSERELSIVRARRLTETGATLESLGETLGISKERVRQIESRALDKLRLALLSVQPDRAAFI